MNYVKCWMPPIGYNYGSFHSLMTHMLNLCSALVTLTLEGANVGYSNDQNVGLRSQHYRSWPDCTDVQTGHSLKFSQICN